MRHVTNTRALRLLGTGRAQEVVVPVDNEGRMLIDDLKAALVHGTPTIVCAQAGEVNTGACDDLHRIADLTSAAGAGCTSMGPSVVLNQVLLRFADDDQTRRVLARVYEDGDVYPSPSTWQGRAAIRISVSSWRTNEGDVERTIGAFRRATS